MGWKLSVHVTRASGEQRGSIYLYWQQPSRWSGFHKDKQLICKQQESHHFELHAYGITMVETKTNACQKEVLVFVHNVKANVDVLRCWHDVRCETLACPSLTISCCPAVDLKLIWVSFEAEKKFSHLMQMTEGVK